jgi:hypothetical protein
MFRYGHLQEELCLLRQASRACHKRFELEVTSKCYVQHDVDPALWILLEEGGAVLPIFSVDDSVLAAPSAAKADALVELVASIFAVRTW